MTRKFKIIFFGILLAFGLSGIIYYVFNYKIQPSDLKEVHGVLLKNPKFGKVKGSRYVEYEIYETEKRYHADATGFGASCFKEGDSITFLIANNKNIIEYLNEKSGVVTIYGIKSRREAHFNLSDINKVRNENKYMLFVFWFILVAIYFHAFWIRKKRSA